MGGVGLKSGCFVFAASSSDDAAPAFRRNADTEDIIKDYSPGISSVRRVSERRTRGNADEWQQRGAKVMSRIHGHVLFNMNAQRERHATDPPPTRRPRLAFSCRFRDLFKIDFPLLFFCF